ncbi:cytochrome c oxidase subunit 8A, mitochondrial [Trichosurus vulpecula]|uniref:cytochrome c oxidase subunit 8A, mitochondrial n=1 Tax=Trichosurus vulpecula TaxID=9337 RepID=UPI00186B52B4|nr:cytochrome c oxidase subunit 8A, mitochondrial [Trichosurus vulpecula]
MRRGKSSRGGETGSGARHFRDATRPVPPLPVRRFRPPPSFLRATLALLLCPASRPLSGPSPRPDAAMSALAPRLLSDLTRPARSLVRVPRAALHARPAREELSTLEKAVGLAASFVCLLVPGGWILSHLENYKKKE